MSKVKYNAICPMCDSPAIDVTRGIPSFASCKNKHRWDRSEVKLWIVHQYKPEKKDDKFEFQGVFDTKQKAIDACKDWSYGIGPAILNEELSSETMPPWEGDFYPLGQIAEA